ncbi:MAG: hypothetical protein EP329_27835 [Deltaproteobacteria bacterium]|nr:MAG: hypothetical protein EP329_27835 [Deltaproteobacteria bacterium]
MAYALREKETTETTPAKAEENVQAKSRTPGDLVPEENKVQAKGQDANDPAKAEKEKAEKERAAKVTAKWESMLGKWLGGKLAPLVLEHVSLDALNGYVKQGLDAAGPEIGKALKGAVDPTKAQEAGLKGFSDALSGVITAQVDEWIKTEKGQKILKAIGGWVDDNPAWVMSIIGTALIGGAVAVWFTNQDLPNIEVPLKLGGTEIKAGLDLGTIQQLGFQGASLVVANKNAKITTKAEVKQKEDKDKGTETTSASLSLAHGDKGKEDLTFVMNGTITKGKDGMVAHTADGTLKLMDPKSGAKITIGADGKWDSAGAGEKNVNFAAETGKDSPVSGKLTINGKNVTIVDANGNIVTTQSASIGVAVGAKGTKFEANAKSEGGKVSGDATLSTEAQLGAGALFKGSAGVEVGDGVTKVKLNGDLSANIAGKPVTFSGAYEQDGPITGMIKVGDGGQYKEIRGTKNGDIVTFATKDVFEGGSVERETSKDNKTGAVTNQVNTTTALGANTTLMGSFGDKGNSIGLNANKVGGTNLNLSGNVGDQGYGVGASYDDGKFKANLDYTMKQGISSLGLSAGLKADNGLYGDASLKMEDSRLEQFALKVGYNGKGNLKSFMVGYKREWQEKNPEYADKFEALLEYSMGNWAGRVQGGVDLQGGQVKRTNLDLSLGRKINDDWAVIGGMQMNGAFDDKTNQFGQSYKPYVGLQHGNVAVSAFYDTEKKAAGVMLSIPLKW